MVKDSEKHASEDKKRKEEAEINNQAESLVHTTEKSLKEHGSKISTQEKSAIEKDLNALKEAIKGKKSDEVKQKMEVLSKSAMKLGEAMYKEAQAAEAAKAKNTKAQGSTDQTGKKEEKVVDADFQDCLLYTSPSPRD